MRPRNPRIAPPKKSSYVLRGGPLDGKQVRLTTPSTLRFTLHGQTGRYAQKGASYATLRWQPE